MRLIGHLCRKLYLWSVYTNTYILYNFRFLENALNPERKREIIRNTNWPWWILTITQVTIAYSQYLGQNISYEIYLESRSLIIREVIQSLVRSNPLTSTETNLHMHKILQDIEKNFLNGRKLWTLDTWFYHMSEKVTFNQIFITME